MKKLYLICAALVVSTMAKGQGDSATLLPGVTVSDTLEPRYSPFEPIKIPNSPGLSKSAVQTLEQETPIVIRQSGPASFASLAYHGLSGAQVSTSWEGIPLRSPSLGLMDLSLIQLGGGTEITLMDGPGWHGGGQGIGGINFGSKPLIKGLTANFGVGLSSLNNRRLELGLGYRGQKWGVRTSLLYRKEANVYQVVDRTNLSGGTYLQDHAGLVQSSNQTEIVRYWKTGKTRLLYWWQDANRELPASLLTKTTSEIQWDRANRLALLHEEYGEDWNHSISIAHIFDYNAYLDSVKDVFGAHRTWQNHLIYRGVRKGNGVHTWFPKFQASREEGVSTNFENQEKWWFQANPGLSYSYRPEKDRHLTLALEQPLHNEFRVKPQASISLSYEGKLGVRAELASHYRFPTLNDRFWFPGGNPNLLPEEGVMGSLHLGYKLSLAPVRYIFQLKLYSLTVEDWIQWSPVNGANYYSPQNLKKVWSRGGDFMFRLQSKHLNVSQVIAYNRAETVETNIPGDQSLGNQLVFRPKWQAKSNLIFNLDRFRLSSNFQWYSKRYVNSDNRTTLDPYGLLGLGLTYTHAHFECGFRIENLLDAYYELQNFYPMPGRYVQLHLNIKPKFNQNP